LDLTKGLTPIHEYWIYLNNIEDEKDRIEEIKILMQEINWRLRPETADAIEKKITGTSQTTEEDLGMLEKIFKGEES
jgi:hypothetical protein